MSDRSRRLIEQSRALIETSFRMVARAPRRVLSTIRGGSTALADREADQRLEIPRILAGLSAGQTRCRLCGKNVPKGAPEYELAWSTDSIVVDRACFVKWQTKFARSGQAPRRF